MEDMNAVPHSPDSAPFSIDPLARVSAVTLAVKDMEGMIQFYTEIMGCTVLDRSAHRASLGARGTAFVNLEHSGKFAPPPRTTGLFHLAILLPSRPLLGQWLRHLVETGYQLDGAGDHLVSEALYLSDPEGNGIELYVDRPQTEWEYSEGRLRMDTLPVDLEGLLRGASPEQFRELPTGARCGHIHLKVNDVSQAIRFYRDDLGFTLTATFPGAGFLSAGGYHHHIGVNEWQSRGAAPAPIGATGLRSVTLQLPSETAPRNGSRR